MKSDVFSVGCVITELVNGTPLFPKCLEGPWYSQEKMILFKKVLGTLPPAVVHKMTLYGNHSIPSISLKICMNAMKASAMLCTYRSVFFMFSYPPMFKLTIMCQSGCLKGPYGFGPCVEHVELRPSCEAPRLVTSLYGKTGQVTHAEHVLSIQASESEFKSLYRAVPTLLGIRKGSIFTAPEQKVTFFAQREPTSWHRRCSLSVSLSASLSVSFIPPIAVVVIAMIPRSSADILALAKHKEKRTCKTAELTDPRFGVFSSKGPDPGLSGLPSTTTPSSSHKAESFLEKPDTCSAATTYQFTPEIMPATYVVEQSEPIVSKKGQEKGIMRDGSGSGRGSTVLHSNVFTHFYIHI